MRDIHALLRRFTRSSAGDTGTAPVDHEPRYHSRFGGLWTDRLDALEEIERRRKAGVITSGDAELLRAWTVNGYVVLNQAVDPGLCDRVRSDIEGVWANADERALVAAPGEQPHAFEPGTPTEKMRVVDIYAMFESAREALLSKTVVRFLRTVFEDDPKLFQSLSFEKGSQQGVHQDTAFVVVDEAPLELAASWIALQDVTAGSGELWYFEGSHRLPDYPFSEADKHYDSDVSSKAELEEWEGLIYENARKMGLKERTFLPKKGDVLIWSADLAHGGSPVKDENATRKSLVGHYCPRRRQPHYFSYIPHRQTVIDWDGAGYSSAYYDL